MLAFPMIICEGENPNNSLMTFSGLLVYNVTTEDGFSRIGGIPHEDEETEDDNWGACRQWWSNAKSKVKRSVFMEDYVYSIALDLINVSAPDDLEHPIAVIDLID